MRLTVIIQRGPHSDQIGIHGHNPIDLTEASMYLTPEQAEKLMDALNEALRWLKTRNPPTWEIE